MSISWLSNEKISVLKRVEGRTINIPNERQNPTYSTDTNEIEKFGGQTDRSKAFQGRKGSQPKSDLGIWNASQIGNTLRKRRIAPPFVQMAGRPNYHT